MLPPTTILLAPVVPIFISASYSCAPILIVPFVDSISIFPYEVKSIPPLDAVRVNASSTFSVAIKLIDELSALISISLPAVPEQPISIPPADAVIVIASAIASSASRLMDVYDVISIS